MDKLWNESIEVQGTEFEKNNQLSIILPEKITKTSLKSIANDLKQKLNIGNNNNPIKDYIRLYAFKSILEDIEDELKELAIEQASKFNKADDTVINGIKFTYKSGAARYNYDNDTVWSELKEKIKEREELLKGLKKSMADAETGEVINLPLITYAKESISINIPKE